METERLERIIQDCLNSFCRARIAALDSLDLKKVLRRKNPYLFRASGISNAADMVEQLLNAHVSSSDETIFGNLFFEPICKAVTKAPIAAATGADFVLETDTTYEVIALKSGPNIFNASQSRKQQDEFDEIEKSLKATLRSLRKQFIPIMGCGYGRTPRPSSARRRFSKMAGQAFWRHVTGDPDFYLKLIRLMKEEPLKTREQFVIARNNALNRFVREFTTDFCGKNGAIDWEKLTTFNSGEHEVI